MLKPSIETLSAAVARLSGDRDAPGEAIAAIAEWNAKAWRTVLLDIPLDEQGYRDRLQIPRADEIGRLWEWWSGDSRQKAALPGHATGQLGFLLLTLIAMHCSDQVRYQDASPQTITLTGARPSELCERLVRDPLVRAAIEENYAPRGSTRAGAPDAAASRLLRRKWDDLDFTTLEFHRLGTTSVILSGWTGTELGNRRLRFALKCIVYPYQRIPAIANATSNYREQYHLTHEDIAGISHLVPVWASHSGWILMDFIEGRTLAELLEDRAAERRAPKREILRPLDFEGLSEFGVPLLTALRELEAHHRHHGDLSPSNIIVERRDDGTARMRLIDLGVNYLYSRSISGYARGDALYVAPEVRMDGDSGRHADLYSLGMLLIAISGVPHTADGTVPDQFYTASVGLARLLEDLVDADPRRRLMVSGIRSDEHRFPRVKQLFQEELEAARASARQPGRRLRGLNRFTPGEGLVKRQRQMLDVRARQAGGGTSFHLRQARRLHRWAWAASWLIWAVFALVLMYWARDLGVDWQARAVEFMNNVIGRQRDGIVLLDDIRAEGYPIPDPWGNLPARLVALSFILAGAKWYMNIVAELTPLAAHRRRGRRRALTWSAEIAMRSAAILPALYVAAPTLVHRDWWPLFTAIGVTTVAVVNSAFLLFARDTVRRAREAGLPTVSSGEIPSLEKFAPWIPSSWLYSVPVWTIGMLLMYDMLEDELVYASAVALINIGIWYIVKCGNEAPHVRVALSRAILAAERLDHIEAETTARIVEPRGESDPSAARLAAP